MRALHFFALFFFNYAEVLSQNTWELQRFALKPKPRDFLKVVRSTTFKKSLVVRFIGNCCEAQRD
jgi:hypothetical protein